MAGISPHKHLDRSYQTFFELATAQIGSAIAEAQAYEEEHRRAEALAELDHAKTLFFTNISHEFRTPLTLMLGPLEDALRNAHGILPLGAARDLQIAHDNARRLLKLVNTLLDFARIEAGRAMGSFQPTDLVTLTREIISSFESLFEKAGLQLIVNCKSAAPEAAPTEQAFVDRDMWEKIVINLVGNAFKFTLHGEVEVSLAEFDGKARLSVRDTGVGIPSEELPRVFERFHRIKATRGRSHEGTGIGLALAQELVKLHGGTIDVASEYGRGSVFTVTILLGSAHLDPRQIATAPANSPIKIAPSALVEEALRWLPDEITSQRFQPEAEAETSADSKQPVSGKPRIVWADDNSDMRIYVFRLLANRFEVETVCDGQAALDAARAQTPDLIVSDVMMPRLDGLELLRRVRADRELREIPVILLSARAGEESRIEGLRLGADDYVVKPFSAPELVARIETHIKVSGIRRQAKAVIQESAVRLRTFTDMAPAILWSAETNTSRAFFSRGWYDYTGQAEEEALGFGWINAIHPEDREECKAIIMTATTKHEPFSMDYRLRRADGAYRWVMGSGRPRFNSGGVFQGFIGSIMDIHERKLAELTSSLLSAIVDSSDDAIISKDLNSVIVSWNGGAERLFGYTAEEAIGKSITMLIPHDRIEEEGRILGSIKRGERVEHFETVRLRKGGVPLNISLTVSPIKDAKGRIVGASQIARDITDIRSWTRN